MTKINISFDLGTPDELFAKFADERLDGILKQKVPAESITLNHNKADRIVAFKGRFVSGELRYDNGQIDIALEIPLLFRPFEKEIRAGITENLRREINR